MNKSELVEALSKRESLRAKEAEKVVNLIFNNFTETLKNGGRIEIRGFGSFVVRNHGSYDGRNPKTGKEIKVAAKKLPYFKVGKDLKNGVNSME
ncbi:MAG: HU family DNA-binding protein [Thermotogota bacterium]|nr:HU family DNA-binding protein [Thermotogota bacterium]